MVRGLTISDKNRLTREKMRLTCTCIHACRSIQTEKLTGELEIGFIYHLKTKNGGERWTVVTTVEEMAACSVCNFSPSEKFK
jgi:hypothetical protein